MILPLAALRSRLRGKDSVQDGAKARLCDRSAGRDQWITSTGMAVWVSTLLVTLPSSTAVMPLLPCEAMTMASQPFSSAVLMIA